MFTTRVRTLLVCSMVAALSACGHSPTAPDTAPPSAVLTQDETVTIPGTDLQVTARHVITSALIDCISNDPRCNLTSYVMLDVKVPRAAAASVDVRLPNPLGGDRVRYGGYVIQMPDLRFLAGGGQQGFRATITATRE